MKHSLVAIFGVALMAASPTLAQSPTAALSVEAEAVQSVDHLAWTNILATHISVDADGVNRFDYAGLKANAQASTALDQYITDLTSIDLYALPRDEQFAAWANLYNALTVQLIRDEYPVKSIMRIRPTLFSIGPWKKEITTVAGRELSLDDIEHGILRKEWDEPRIHYAVNCASYGCPNLQPKAWTADTLDADLTAAAIDYVNHSRGVTIRKDGRLQVSTIYKWFREDFGDSEAGVVKHLLDYAEPELAAMIRKDPRIADYEYDWSLNEAASPNS